MHFDIQIGIVKRVVHGLLNFVAALSICPLCSLIALVGPPCKGSELLFTLLYTARQSDPRMRVFIVHFDSNRGLLNMLTLTYLTF